MKVINFKLVNGDEIIAQLVPTYEDLDFIVVDSPRALQFNSHADGRVGAAFVPALVLGNDKGIKVYKNSISLYTDSVGAEYEKHYLQSVSGIQLATTLNG
jgi:hypothetical protein